MTFLTVDLDLPNHEEEFIKCDEYVEKLKSNLYHQRSKKFMDLKLYVDFYDKITRGLYYVGTLSEPALGVRDQLETLYFKTYKHAPELARKEWQEHYAEIHKYYNLYKNRLFRLYELLDDIYSKINKSLPPLV